MARFRKRPVEVEAEQWFPGRDVPGVEMYQPPDFVIGGRGQGEQRFAQKPYPVAIGKQGQVRVDPGDWIIREMDGSGYYPCKPDVFERTYELVAETPREAPVE